MRHTLVHWPGIELMPPAVEVLCLNDWTTKEVPQILKLSKEFFFTIKTLRIGKNKW